MTNEIKEILNKLQKCKDDDEEILLIKQYGATLIINYITNLQQEKEDYKSRIDKAIKNIKNIFEDEKWYENYDYNDLENVLKNVLNILQNGSEE